MSRDETDRRINGSGANSTVIMDHGKMQRFVSLDALFIGRSFDRQIISFASAGAPVSN